MTTKRDLRILVLENANLHDRLLGAETKNARLTLECAGLRVSANNLRAALRIALLSIPTSWAQVRANVKAALDGEPLVDP